MATNKQKKVDKQIDVKNFISNEPNYKKNVSNMDTPIGFCLHISHHLFFGLFLRMMSMLNVCPDCFLFPFFIFSMNSNNLNLLSKHFNDDTV